jgi:hypothetical protein
MKILNIISKNDKLDLDLQLYMSKIEFLNL